MIDILNLINKKYENKYSYLKLYEVSYDKKILECVITFLYPHEINDILEEDRKNIQEVVQENIKINGKVVVKFKKSFLDERLIKKEIVNYINDNFKAGSVYFNENQINVENSDFITKINIFVGDDIKNYFESSNFSLKLTEYLSEKFICEFDIQINSDEKYAISKEIGEVEVPVLQRKNHRYDAYIVKSLFGGPIAPKPEFIKDNKEPKSAVILAGTIEDFQKKTFVKKKGKLAGQEGTYYTFSLNDGKKIDSVYFSNKTNTPKMDNLTNGMSILCLGDLKMGLSNKLTYYISRLAIANIDEESKIIKPENSLNKHKAVVLPEEFIALKQSDIFAKAIKYNDYIMDNTFVVYDLETTGLDPQSDKIIEIGAVKIEKGRVIQKFSTFINPEIHIPEEAARVNNITDDMVKDAPSISDAILDFLDFIKDCIVSGYNNINFDNKFISKVTKDLNLKFDNETIDVYNVVREKQVRAKNHKLTSVVEALGITLEGAHRAYNDAYATAQVLLKLNEA